MDAPPPYFPDCFVPCCHEFGPWLTLSQGCRTCLSISPPFPFSYLLCVQQHKAAISAVLQTFAALNFVYLSPLDSSVCNSLPFLVRPKQLPWSAKPFVAETPSDAASAASSSTVTLEGATMDDWIPGAAATAGLPLLQENVRSTIELEIAHALARSNAAIFCAERRWRPGAFDNDFLFRGGLGKRVPVREFFFWPFV